MIIVVELEDTDDQTGANITVLISQLEQDVRIQHQPTLSEVASHGWNISVHSDT